MVHGPKGGGHGVEVYNNSYINATIYFAAVYVEDRNEEHGLKWMTGIVVSIGFLSFFVVLFMCLHRIRKMKMKLEHPDWVAHRKSEQARRKLEKEQMKEERRMEKLNKVFKRRSKVAPEPFMGDHGEDDAMSRGTVYTDVRGRVPTVSDLVDRYAAQLEESVRVIENVSRFLCIFFVFSGKVALKSV